MDKNLKKKNLDIFISKFEELNNIFISIKSDESTKKKGSKKSIKSDDVNNNSSEESLKKTCKNETTYAKIPEEKRIKYLESKKLNPNYATLIFCNVCGKNHKQIAHEKHLKSEKHKTNYNLYLETKKELENINPNYTDDEFNELFNKKWEYLQIQKLFNYHKDNIKKPTFKRNLFIPMQITTH